MSQTVLISGGSIAGPALAFWLAKAGFKPTIVERAPAVRPGGHAIDVRGTALDVLEWMGLLDIVRANRTGMKGVSTIAADGTEIWRSETMTITGGDFDNPDIEILRDDLSNLLWAALPSDVEALFDDTIVDLQETTEGVDVSFARELPRRFDFVVGADGVRSNVRKLAFGQGEQFLHPMGAALAVFSAPNHIALKDWQINCQGDAGNCLVYTALDNQELRVCFGFSATFDDVPRDHASQMAMIRDRCAGLGWETGKFLEAMPTARDFYLGVMAQVKMPAWSRGRTALLGDAAYCPSPFSGQGTSLSLVGAYVLATALAQSSDGHAAAFARYEAVMRPYVNANQAIGVMAQSERFNEPDYYAEIQAALNKSKFAVDLEGFAPA